MIERSEKMYKLLAVDCDGTLLNDNKKIGSKTVELLKQAKNRGLKIVLATSKSFFAVKKYLNELELLDGEQYTIAFNSAYVINNDETKCLENSTLSKEAIRKIIDYGRQFDLYMFLYERDRIISSKTCEEYTSKNKHVPFDVIPFDELDLDSLNIYKVIMHSENFDEVKRAKDGLDDSFDTLCSYSSSNKGNVEFVTPNSFKEYGLKILSEALNIDSSEMIGFGDNENDLGMFAYVGYKVAMGNSIEDLKKAADYVTLSNNEDGIAIALEMLIEKGII